MINSYHLLKILDAELKSIDEKTSPEDIGAAYENAIKVSTRSGFRQDAALVSERHAVYLADRFGDDTEHKEQVGYYIRQAVEFYSECFTTSTRLATTSGSLCIVTIRGVKDQ